MAAIGLQLKRMLLAAREPKVFFLGFVALVVVYLVAMPLVVLLMGSFKFGPLALEPDNYVRAIAQDREGNLWFGTREGASRYDGKDWRTFTMKDGLVNDRVTDIALDSAGNLWFASNSGVTRYDGITWIIFDKSDGLARDRITSIAGDSAGNLWFGTSGGVSRYDGETWRTFTEDDGLVDDSVLAIAEDSVGNMWFGTKSGVSRYDGETWHTFTEADGLADDLVQAIARDSAGNLWFGTKRGASRYDGETWLTFTTEYGLVDNDVRAIAQDRAGNLWFGTKRGASRYDGKAWLTLTEADGLAHDHIQVIAEDSGGNLWLGTSDGVSLSDGEKWRTFLAGGAGAGNYVLAYSDPNIVTPLRNSVIFAGLAALLGFAIGTAFAWLVERTNVPMKNLASAFVLVPLIMPGVLFAISWVFLLSPNIGLINVIIKAMFGLEEAPFNIHSLAGMIWLEGLVMAPLVFILMSASFRSMDPSLEEAASVSGAGILTTARRITFKLMLPATISVLLIIFVRGMEAFEIPAILGIPSGIMVFSTKIFLALQKVPKDYGLASTLGVSMIVLSATGVFIYHKLTAKAYKYATVTGKGYRPRVIDLGRWRWVAAGSFIAYFLFTVGLPFFILLWMSLLPYYSVPSLDRFSEMSLVNYSAAWNYPNATRAIRNTMILGVSAATLIVLISAVISWIVVRTRMKGRQILDILAFMPIAIPGIVSGLAVMWAYLTFMDWLPVYGTLWILIIAYTGKYMPYGTRATNAGLLQIHKELEEVAETSGASWWRTFTKVTLPLLMPALVSAWIYIFMVSVRSLGEAILLYTSKSEVISVLIYDMREGGETNVLAALGVMVITFMVAVIFTVRALGAKVGAQRA